MNFILHTSMGVGMVTRIWIFQKKWLFF